MSVDQSVVEAGVVPPNHPNIPPVAWWAVFSGLTGFGVWSATGDVVTAVVCAAAAFIGVPAGQFIAKKVRP